MAQVKLLKISSDGIPAEFDSSFDEVTLASFSIADSGPVLSDTGLDMSGQNITDVPEVHSASSLKLVADAGDVELKASTDKIQLLNQSDVQQGEFDTSSSELKLSSSIGDLKFQSNTDLFKWYDNTGTQQGTISVSGTNFQLASVGDMFIQSGSDLINFQDQSPATRVSMDFSNVGFSIIQSSDDLRLEPTGNLEFAPTSNQILFKDSPGLTQQGMIDVSGGEFKLSASVGDLVLDAASSNIDASAMTVLLDNITFDDPATSTINQTAANLIIDNIMAKERENVMTSSGSMIFSAISDSAGEVDSFRMPYLEGIPSAAPAHDSDGGYMVYDNVSKAVYVWDGSAWDSLSSANSSAAIDLPYTAGEALIAGDAVYIDSSGQAFKADKDVAAATQVVGFAIQSVALGASVLVRVTGKVGGLSGLTVGSRYYLSDDGTITSSVPSASGEYIVQAGYAVSATELLVMVQQIGQRA